MKHSGISQGGLGLNINNKNYILFMKSTDGMTEKTLTDTKV